MDVSLFIAEAKPNPTLATEVKTIFNISPAEEGESLWCSPTLVFMLFFGSVYVWNLPEKRVTAV